MIRQRKKSAAPTTHALKRASQNTSSTPPETPVSGTTYLIRFPGDAKSDWHPEPTDPLLFKVVGEAIALGGEPHTYRLIVPEGNLRPRSLPKFKKELGSRMAHAPLPEGDGPIDLDLTRSVKLYHGRQVGRSPTKDKLRELESVDKANDPLAALQELAAPKQPPREILALQQILETAGKLPPAKRREFVEAVNAILHRTNYCFQLEPDKAIARKLYLNEGSSQGGDIQFQLTRGGLRGFVRTAYKLTPYVPKARTK